MTPFELAVENDLNIEAQRFHDQWLFKWYGMTYEGGKTDVEDFRGGRISYAGIQFGYQQQTIYWQAIDRYLLLKVHEIFKRWEAETKGYPTKMRLASITGVERILGRFVTTITQKALNTAQRLRNVSGGTLPSGFRTGTPPGAEVERLAQAHKALLEEEIKREAAAAMPQIPAMSRRQKFEKFLSDHKGLLALLSFLAAVAFGLYRIFVG